MSAEPVGTPFGKYRLVRSIGLGGMAEVFLAFEASDPNARSVAVKRLRPHLGSTPSLIEMFRREAELAARIKHPNVVRTLEFGQVGQQHYIAMEYVRGWDLEELQRRCRDAGERVPVEIACQIVIDLCAGLFAAHSCVDDQGQLCGIIHRDLSPHNVLVSTGGLVKLTDFGLAKAVDSVEITMNGDPKGKVGYLAPEVARREGRRLDARVDVFGAGVLLYELLTLDKLFRRKSDVETLEALLHAPIPSVAAQRDDVSPALDRILLRALARERDLRYPTARALGHELSVHLASLGRSEPPQLLTWLAALIAKVPTIAVPGRTGWSRPR